jgi:hypothetical protein
MRATAGLAEQATWVLLRARSRPSERAPADAALFAELGRSFVARCELREGACRRPIDRDGAIALDDGAGSADFVTHWHPWATLASAALARDRSIELPDDLRAALAAMARWGASEMDRGRVPLRAAASYKLAEYLFVASELAR